MVKDINGQEPAAPVRSKRQVSFVERLIEKAIGNGASVGLPDDPAATKWPQLWEWLTRVYYGKDRIKTPPSLTIQVGPGGIVVRVADRDMAQQLEINVPHLENVFDALEQELNLPLPRIKSLGKKEPTIRTRKKQ